MSIEASHKFNQLVKRVEFFPFEWSANLLAVCFNDSVKIFKFVETFTKKEEPTDITNSTKDNIGQQSKLNQIISIPFQQKIDNFSWNPKTVITSLKPVISFAVSDSSQNIIFSTCNPNLITESQHSSDIEPPRNIQTYKENDVDCIYNISFDHQNGELLAFTGDNYCFLLDTVDLKLRAKFLLQSPGINICWHRDEKTKLMVGEKSGVIRIFSLETLKPVYSILCYNDISKVSSFPLFSFDWSQMNPEVIIANTNTEIFIWNTSKSCLPEKTIENFEKLKIVKLCQFKDNLVGFIDGHDACSKLTIMNFRSNQTIYQSKSLKLLNSFSFNSILPVVALSNEQQVVIKKVVG